MRFTYYPFEDKYPRYLVVYIGTDFPAVSEELHSSSSGQYKKSGALVNSEDTITYAFNTGIM
jgi:hypothetical protein